MSTITSYLTAVPALLGAIILAVTWIYKKITNARQVASNAAVRAERLKPIDQELTATHTEAKDVEAKTESYEQRYGVKLVHPIDSDDKSGSNH